MRQSWRRTASEIAEQQLEALVEQADCAGADARLDGAARWLADLLVTGDDRRPCLVRRFVECRAGGASRLYGVSVAVADPSRRPRPPVIRTVVAVEPGTVLNGSGPRLGANRWSDVDKRR
jgi:hypothetical protein